jgi:O-antigen/teichoic acid export membrane protein
MSLEPPALLDGEEPLAAQLEPTSLRFASALGLRDAGRVLRDFVVYLPTQVIPAVAGFLALPILARHLAPTELGVLTIAQTSGSLGWILTSQWLTSAVMRELPAARKASRLREFRRVLERSAGLALALLMVFAGIVAIFGAVSGALRGNVALIVAVTLGLSIQNMAGTLFSAELRTRPYALFDLFARTGGIVLGIYLVLEGHKIQGYLLGLALASLVVGAVGLVVAWPRVPGDEAEQRGRETQSVRAWIDYGIPVAVSASALWGLLFVDRYLLAAFDTAGTVGVYSLGSVVGDKVVSVPALAFYTAARPLLLKAYERSGRSEVERLMRQYTRVILLFGAPIVAYVALVRRDLISVLANGFYTQQYVAAAAVVPLVALGSLLYAVGLIGAIGLSVARRTRKLVYGSAAGLAANVAANLVLIPPYGAVGAAVSTPVGMAAFVLVTRIWAREHATWHFPFAPLARVALATAGGTAAAYAATWPFRSPYVVLVVAAAVGVGVYALCLWLLGELRASPSGRFRAGSSSS